MSFDVIPIVIGVSRYTSNLFVLSKKINYIVTRYVDTYHIDGDFFILWLDDNNHMYQRGYFNIATDRCTFEGITTVIFHSKLGGLQLKVIMTRFPNVKNVIFKIQCNNVLRNLPNTVSSISGVIDIRRTGLKFPPLVEEATLLATNSTIMMSRRVSLHIICKNGTNCVNLPRNAVAVDVPTLNADLSMSAITSLKCADIDDVSYLPLRLVSLEYYGDAVNLSKLQSLQTLKCHRICNTHDLPVSLTSIEYAGSDSLDLSHLNSLKSLVTRCIDSKSKLPHGLQHLKSWLFNYVPKMPNLQSLKIQMVHKSLKWHLLPESLRVLHVNVRLNRSIAFRLPRNLIELKVKEVVCTRLPFEDLRHLIVRYQTDQLLPLKLIVGDQFLELGEANCTLTITHGVKHAKLVIDSDFDGDFRSDINSDSDE